MPDFDAIIIGTAFRLAGARMKVAVIERHLVGGTCVNTGCTPTKALVASAYAARIARRAAEYGVVIGGDIGIDMRRVKARQDAIVAASRNGLTSALVSAALKADSVPERALLRAEEVDLFALSAAVDGEIAGVLNRPRFARAIPLARHERVLERTASILRKAKQVIHRPSALNWIAQPVDNLQITEVRSLLHCSCTPLLAAFAAP